MNGIKKATEKSKEWSESPKPTHEIEIDILNQMYDNYLKKEEYITGVLNTKSLSQKNADFRNKLWVWKESQEIYAKNEERIIEKEQIVIKTLDKYQKDINLENNLIKASK